MVFESTKDERTHTECTLTLQTSLRIQVCLNMTSTSGCFLVLAKGTQIVPRLLCERLSGSPGRLEAKVSQVPALGPVR